jgi:hypothetical protein
MIMRSRDKLAIQHTEKPKVRRLWAKPMVQKINAGDAEAAESVGNDAVNAQARVS